MMGYRGKSQFTVINHSNRAKTIGYGVTSNLQKSFIQKKHKTRDYRGKMHFTAINHSNREQNTGLQR
jgi:hypothetical protein